MAFADLLVSALKKGLDENETNEMVLFQVRCLWFLCESGSDQGAIQKTIREISDYSKFTVDVDIQNAVDNLISFYA